MDGGYDGDHGGCGGGFANFVNYQKQNYPSSFRHVPHQLTAIDRFLWGRTRARIDQSQNHISQYQNHEINEAFINTNGLSEFSCLSGRNESQLCFAPSSPMANNVAINGIGECVTWEELSNFPNYDPNHKSKEVEVIEPEKILEGKKSKGGNTSKVLIKGQWTDEEDMKLIRLVNQYGVRKWAVIAKNMNGRAGKQCRERWRNHLCPDIKKDSWSEEEVRMLIEAHQKIGNKWVEIAKLIPGRTENSIKNQWNATKRRQNSSLKNKKNDAKNRKSQSSLLQDYIRSKTSTDQNLASSSFTTTNTITTTITIESSTMIFPELPNSNSSTLIFPELTNSNSNNSDPSLEISQSYDDELNFMKNLFETTISSNESSDHVIEPRSLPKDELLGFSGISQYGFSLSSLTLHDHENLNMYLNNNLENETLKTQVASDVGHLEEDIAMLGFSDRGCQGDGSSPNAKKTWIW